MVEAHSFEILSTGTFLYRGTVGMDSRPATISSRRLRVSCLMDSAMSRAPQS